MSTSIHPTALVSPEAQIDEGCVIGPYCIVGPNVHIARENTLVSHVIMDGHVQVGEKNIFHPFCSIGAPPQDLTYKGEPTKVIIGQQNTFREYVSIHRGTLKDKGLTQVGNQNLFMAYVHIGHDGIIGNNCVFVNTVNLAGHVSVGDRVIIGGGTMVGQFCILGRGAYVGGATAIDHDIPCFCTAVGNRVKLKGINIIGLKRQGFSKKIISEVVDFFRMMESSRLSPRYFVTNEQEMAPFKENEIIQEMARMIEKSEHGIAPFLD